MNEEQDERVEAKIEEIREAVRKLERLTDADIEIIGWDKYDGYTFRVSGPWDDHHSVREVTCPTTKGLTLHIAVRETIG